MRTCYLTFEMQLEQGLSLSLEREKTLKLEIRKLKTALTNLRLKDAEEWVAKNELIVKLKKALRDISDTEDLRKAQGAGYDIIVDVMAKLVLGDI